MGSVLFLSSFSAFSLMSLYSGHLRRKCDSSSTSSLHTLQILSSLNSPTHLPCSILNQLVPPLSLAIRHLPILSLTFRYFSFPLLVFTLRYPSSFDFLSHSIFHFSTSFSSIASSTVFIHSVHVPPVSCFSQVSPSPRLSRMTLVPFAHDPTSHSLFLSSSYALLVSFPSPIIAAKSFSIHGGVWYAW